MSVATPRPQDLRALVAIDLGAESCRVSLLRWLPDGPTVQVVYRFPNQVVQQDGGVYWDIERIYRELLNGLTQCADIASEGIRSIAVDGWAVDYVRLDENGEAVSQPFCYRDERTLAAEELLHQRITPERLRDLTGLQLLRINTAYQLAADVPEVQAMRWLNLPEYVLYRLGARPVAERTNASHTQLLGLDGEWCAEIFRAVDSSMDSAPELVDPGTDVGALRGPLTAMPAFADTRLIAPACHDTASAIAAIPDSGDDWAYISSGTWSLVGTVLGAPLNTAEARGQNFTNLRGVDNTICFHKNVNGMWLLRQCLDSWSETATPAELKQLDVATLVLAASAFSDLGYTLDVDDPDLLLPGHMPDRINAQLHRRGLPRLETSAEYAPAMASFLFHSLAARYAEVLKSIAIITGKHLARVYILGGGSQNTLLNRLTAEATGLDVVRAGTECSTIGNFAVQLAALERTSEQPLAVHAWVSQLQGF